MDLGNGWNAILYTTDLKEDVGDTDDPRNEIDLVSTLYVHSEVGCT